MKHSCCLKIFGFLILLFLENSRDGFSQLQNNDCIVDLKKTFSTLNGQAKNVDQKIRYYKYSVFATPKKEKKVTSEIQKSNFEVFYNNKKSLVKNSNIESIQDKNISISILPKEKTIFLSPGISLNEEYFKKAAGFASFLQDSILDMSEVINCEITGEDSLLRIKLKFNIKGRKVYNLTFMELFLEKNLEMFKRIIFYYSPGEEYSQIEYVFDEYNLNYKTDLLQNPAAQYIFNSNNSLLDKYKGFKIIDNRRQKK